MGGRGASSGISVSGKPYGSEFRTLLKAGNVKFVKQNAALNAKDPLETMTKGRVYPSISWSDENSYDWCFDGDPVGGIVAVSSVGTQQNKESKRLFLRGYEEMMKRLSPEWVIFYGRVPEECDWNVIRVKPHYDEIVKRRVQNEISVHAGTA